jgi:hypothetical protein
VRIFPIVIHVLTLDCEKRKHSGETISSQTVSTGSTRHDVAGIRIGYVLDSADKDAQVAPSKRNDAQEMSCRAVQANQKRPRGNPKQPIMAG